MSIFGTMLAFFEHLRSSPLSDETSRVLTTRFIDVILSGNDGMQDVAVSAACLEALLFYIQREMPKKRKVVLLSDNGPHFSSHDMLGFILCLNRRLRRLDGEPGDVLSPASDVLQIYRYIFTEPQCGKDRVDSHFAYLKTAFKSWVNHGNNVTTPREAFVGATKGRDDGSGVIAGSAVALLKIDMSELPKFSEEMRRKLTKTKGIRSVGDIRFPLATLTKTEVQLSELCVDGEDKKAYQCVSFSEEFISGVEKEGLFGDTGCRFSFEPTAFQSSPMPEFVASERKTRDPNGKLEKQSSLERACGEAYKEFIANEASMREKRESMHLNSQVDVASEIENVAEVNMSRTVAKRRRPRQVGGPDFEDLQLGCARKCHGRIIVLCGNCNPVGTLFGLKKPGFARRKTAPVDAIPTEMERNLKKIFNLGQSHGLKRSPAEAHEQIFSGLMSMCWRLRAVVTEARIKQKFSTWASEAKKKKKSSNSSSVRGAAEGGACAGGLNAGAVDTGGDVTISKSPASQAVNSTTARAAAGVPVSQMINALLVQTASSAVSSSGDAPAEDDSGSGISASKAPGAS